MVLEFIQGEKDSLIDIGTRFVKEHPIGVGLGAAAVLGAGGILAIKGIRKKKRSKIKRRKKHVVRRKTRRVGKKGKRRPIKYARTAGKRKDRSTRRIRMTKHGQPYIILRSGKARFIKKTSARRSRKLKGGRY